MRDYYAILGVDPGASHESIKIAYRRLARQTHPDRNVHASEVANRAQSAEMARLNEAYAVLADAKRRREYDDTLRTRDILTHTNSVGSASTASSVTGVSSTGVGTTVGSRTGSRSTITGQRAATRTRHDADPAVVREFASHLHTKFLTDRKAYPWKEVEAEGFDWAMECTFWSSHYFVALRGFGVVDPPAVKKVTSYADITFARFNRQLRKSNFLFILPFQYMTEWDSISVQCQRLIAGEGVNKPSGALVGIILLDVQHGRTLRIGAKTADKRYEELVQWIGAPPE